MWSAYLFITFCCVDFLAIGANFLLKFLAYLQGAYSIRRKVRDFSYEFAAALLVDESGGRRLLTSRAQTGTDFDATPHQHLSFLDS